MTLVSSILTIGKPKGTDKRTVRFIHLSLTSKAHHYLYNPSLGTWKESPNTSTLLEGAIKGMGREIRKGKGK